MLILEGFGEIVGFVRRMAGGGGELRPITGGESMAYEYADTTVFCS